MALGKGPRPGNVIVPSDWAAFYRETHVPAAVRVGDTLHVGGHTGETADDVFSADPATQIRQTFTNIADTLAEAGATWADVVSMTTYHVGLSAQKIVALAVAAEFLRDPYPAWTAVGVTELWEPAAIIEISCIALLGPAAPS
ncbi:MAG: Rid family hydrolase [Candidatus Limnocylindrales bacterium]